MKRSFRSVAFLLLLFCGVLAACELRVERVSRVDEAAMAVLNTARALHHEADAYESAGDYAAASRAIERVLALRIPAAVQEGEEVRTDAWGRLAELALSADQPERALAHADTGLRDGSRESVLRARLFVVRGRALRALGDRAQASGDEATARARREEAIAAWEQSIQMNQRVLGRLLDGGL